MLARGRYEQLDGGLYGFPGSSTAQVALLLISVEALVSRGLLVEVQLSFAK